MKIGNLTWDDTGDRVYYTGIDGVALYVWDETESWYTGGIAWNGVTAINESPSGAESNKFYADNIEYLNLLSKEEFGCTLECYQVPFKFGECDGLRYDPPITGVENSGNKVMFHQQPRKSFGLVYRVQKGSDTTAAGELGYVYHVVYGCKASPSSRDFATVNDSPEAQTFSYEISTTPLTDTEKIGTALINAGIKELVHLEIDSSGMSSTEIVSLEGTLYSSGYMPDPYAIYNIGH